MSFENNYSQFNETVNAALDPLNEYYYVKLTLALCLLLYGGLAAPAFPTDYLYLFKNFWFRLAFLSLIALTTIQTPVLGIAVSVVFLYGMDAMLHTDHTENYEDGPKTYIFPGCTNMTAQDLLDSFKGDQTALESAMLNSKIPLNISITDDNAPLIATFLLNRGFVLKSPCQWPNPSENLAMS